MKRTTTLTLAISASLLTAALAACQPTDTTAGSSNDGGSAPSVSITAGSTMTSSAGPTTAAASPTAAPSNCPDRPDIYLWMRTDGVPDTAQRLSGTNQQTCEPSYKMLMATAPTVPGSCTELASVADNPGYNPDATPAARLKHVLYSVGPAC